MSAFYDQASLVVVPSGYKSGKIYAQKPLTTDGQLTFTRASTATRVNASGLIETVASGVPRLDYLGSTCPRLLLEPQRTNSFTYSEQFNNAAWTTNLGTVTANASTSPDGTTSADTFTPTSASTNSSLANFVITSAATHTMSVYAKVASGTKSFRFFRFNGTDGSVTSPTFTATTSWQRFTWTTTPTVAGTSWYIANAAADTIAFSIWGAQLELGAYATSYVKTEAAAVTRLADLCNKISVSSLIGQTEGTIFGELSFDDIGAGGASSYIYITDGSFANAVVIGREPASLNSKFMFYIQASSVNILNNTTNNITSGVVKMALAYKSGDWAAYLNGNLVASGSSTFTFNASINRFAIGPNDGSQTVVQSSVRAAQALLFKTRLTNAQLAELTTL